MISENEKRINELEAALLRADDIINWMEDYIGKMCPPPNGLADWNAHGLFMERDKGMRAAKNLRAGLIVP